MVDVAIVGAGIIGLAHAYHAAKQGYSVAVFERSPQAMGASVRNFGMIWPIGQPAGRMYGLALRSRNFWNDVLKEVGLWHRETGSLHLAYHDDEWQVLSEFAAKARELDYRCELIGAEEVGKRSPAVKQAGLKGALWSGVEICVDPRQVIAELPDWLNRTLGVQFHFNTAVCGIALPEIETGSGTFWAKRALVCSGDDFQTLYPELFTDSGLTRCKLQMMRTTAFTDGWNIGPMLAAGLTLKHYTSFQVCQSLPALKARFDAELPDYEKWGIHVLVSQNGRGEVTLGDSHEYGLVVAPFDKAFIDDLVLKYLNTFLEIPNLQIAERWHGVYAKHADKSFLIERPAENVTVVTGVGGAGMTLSFGLAEEVAAQL